MLMHYETQRLILEVLTPDYSSQVLDFYCKNKEAFQPYEPCCLENYYTEEYQYNCLNYEYKTFLEGRGVRFYLFAKDAPDTIIGTISFSNITRGYLDSAVIGYKLDTCYQHQGFAFEALQKGIEILFYEEGIHRINAYIMPENHASIRLIEKLYFTYEGLAREYALIQGKWEDHLQYSLINHL